MTAPLTMTFVEARRTRHRDRERTAAAARALAAHQLTEPMFDALFALTSGPATGVPLTKLARLASVSSGGMTKLADKLVDQGLLTRQTAPDDRRVIAGVITDAGRERLQAAVRDYTAAIAAVVG